MLYQCTGTVTEGRRKGPDVASEGKQEQVQVREKRDKGDEGERAQKQESSWPGTGVADLKGWSCALQPARAATQHAAR